MILREGRIPELVSIGVDSWLSKAHSTAGDPESSRSEALPMGFPNAAGTVALQSGAGFEHSGTDPTRYS